MDVISLGPLAATSVLWQPKPGSWTFTVVCKATYVLAPGESPLAEEQEAPSEADGHWDDDPERSLCFASDLAPIKTHAEVTVVGHAYSPDSAPVRSLVARFAIGEVDRSIEVCADRAVAEGGVVQEGAPFTHMPLVYERARGGPDSWNPVGIPASARDSHGRILLPNLQSPGATPDAIEAVGWGPIAPAWPGRRSKLGRRPPPDPANLATAPLPWGFDLGFFNSAPPEQRIRALRDNEKLVLENLHPDHARLSTRLPGVRPRAYVDRGGAAPSPVTMRADTLMIDTDRGVCHLVFRGHFPIAHPEERGRVLVGVERGTEHRSWAEVVQAASAYAATPPAVTRSSLPIIELEDHHVMEDFHSTTMEEGDAKEALNDTLPFAKPSQASFAEVRAQLRGQRAATDLPFVTPGAGGVSPLLRGPSAPSAPAAPSRGRTVTLAIPDPSAPAPAPVSPAPVPPATMQSPPPPPVVGAPASLRDGATGTFGSVTGTAPPILNPPASLGGFGTTGAHAAMPGIGATGAHAAMPGIGTTGAHAAMPGFGASGGSPPVPGFVPSAPTTAPPISVPPVPNSVRGAVPAPPGPAPSGPPGFHLGAPAPASPGPPGAPAAPILRALPGAESPWAGGAPTLAEPTRGTIGTLAAAQAGAQAEPAAIKDAGAQNAVLRASNAAAGKSATEPLVTDAKRPATPAATTPTPASPGETGRIQAIPSLEVVDLVWFERAALPRIRKNPAWRALVHALEDRPPDPDLDDATLGNTPAEVEDRRDVFEVLTRGTATDAAGIEDALSSAVRTDGKVVPPFVLAAGDLAFPFDEVEVLKAHVAIISPLAAGDDKLKSEIALVREFLANPELACAPPMVEALSNRLWEAFGKNKRAVPAETLKAHSDSVLLQKRRFQKREIFGSNHLRALLHAGQGGGPFPAYLPAGLAAVLPMYQRFRTRLFAEVHLAVDQHESCPTALRVVAVARVVERIRRVAPTAAPVVEVVNPRESRPA